MSKGNKSRQARRKIEKEKAMTALRKVLVVDDDPVIGKSFDRVLSKKGYAVITAKNGEEALSKLAAERYDVVYTDIKMPGMSGLEVAERVKAERPWTPVVIITGHGTPESETRAKAAGVAEFLHKPLSPDMIEGSAHKALAAATAAAETQAATAEPVGSTLKNVALFFAAPFIGLAYLMAFPFVGMAVLAWYGWQAAREYAWVRKVAGIARHVGMALAAPVLGLAFIVVFPFVGIAALAWMGARSLIVRDTN
jgi:CheY-like chemotaxis protein